MPSIAGDAIRVMLLYDAGSTLRTAFNSALLDRGFAMLALLALAAVSLLSLGPPIISANPYLWPIAGSIGAGFAVLVFVLSFAPWLAIILARFHFLGAVVGAIMDMRRILLSVKQASIIMGLCLTVHCLTMLMFGLLVRGQGVALSAIDVFAIVPLIAISAMIPIGFAGWGMREGLVVAFLATIGIQPEAALLLSVSFGTVVLVASLPGALIYFSLLGRSPTRVRGRTV